MVSIQTAALGPGFLFAGAAVGVSHLVQSTRAGAMMGVALLGVIIAANVVKYVPFSFGPRYAVATGTTLLEGYRRQGRWALCLYGVLTVATMFTVQAAVVFVTAAIAKAVFGLAATALAISVGLLVICAVILVFGGFAWLDRIMKVVVVLLTLLTVTATALAVPNVQWSTFRVVPDFSGMSLEAIFFLAALIGWMPSAIDISVWHSLWTIARRRQTGHAPTMRNAMLDFNVGYIGTAVLALCFVLLGAGVVYGSGQPIAKGPVGFANQVIELYTSTLGTWSRPFIGGCALLVMFSTSLTVIDGFPRALSSLVARFRGPELPGVAGQTSRRPYWVSVVIIGLGSLVIIAWFIKSLKGLVDLATTLSFLTAPLLSWLNHRAVLSPEVPVAARPGRGLVMASWASIATQAVFALWYLVLRFTPA